MLTTNANGARQKNDEKDFFCINHATVNEGWKTTFFPSRKAQLYKKYMVRKKFFEL